MADPIVLGSLDAALNELPGARPLLSASGSADLAWLPGATVSDLVVRHEPPASLVAEATLLVDPQGAVLMTLGPTTVRLAPSPVEGERPLLVRITLGAAPALDLYDLRVSVDLAQPWLHRVDPRTWQPTGEPFRFEVDARLRIAGDGTTDCECFGLTIPPFEVGRTGIVIALEGCRPAVDGVGVPVSLRDLLRTSGQMRIDGLYARRARLSWLPRFRFPGDDLPGFSFNFRDVLLDGTGVSFTLDETWAVERVTGTPHRLSPRCAMLGRLFGDRVRVALERATGTVLRNEPIGFALEGWIEIRSLAALLEARFSAERDPQQPGGLVGLTLDQEAGTRATVDLGVGALTIEEFSAEGLLKDDSFSATGSARAAIDLPGWQSGALAIESSLETSAERTSLSIAIGDVGLGPLGRLATAAFDLTFTTEDEDAPRLESFGIRATLVWRDVAAQLGFADLPPNLPLPADDAQVTASGVWDDDGGLTLALEASAGDATNAFGFLPAAFRPEARAVTFGFRASYVDAADFFASQPGDPIAGEVFAKLSFRPALPDELQDNGVLTLHAGDAEGFVDAALTATVEADGSATLSLEIDTPVSLEVALPGVTGGPLFVAALTHAVMTLASGADESDPSATIEFTGEFGVLPASIVLSDLVGPQVAAMFDPLTSLALHGSVTATLRLADGRAALTLTAELTDAELEIDLLEQIGRLAAGQGGAERGVTAEQRQARQDLDLDLSFRFSVDGLAVEIGDLEGDTGEAMPASVEVRFSAGVAGATLPAFVRLSMEELVIGVEGAEIPLRLPRFPLSPGDVQAAAEANGHWSRAALDALVEDVGADLAAAAEGAGRRAAAERGLLVAKEALLVFIRDTWSSLSSTDARNRYQDGVIAFLTVLDDVSGLTHSESNVRLEIGSARLRVPFDDPRAIAVEGGATLKGFAPDDPLHALDGLTLRLGLSPDQIYFALEGSGEPIELPAVGRYEKGSISLSQLAIGYGFTRNSLAVAFAGELVYPEHLTEDLNTSEVVGFGITLPRYNRLAFRLDVIPVPGPIPVVPMVEFSFDLRTPGLPALRGTRPCLPAFDGLEVDIPGVIHADVKALSLSPMLGIIPAVNVRFDGDVELGNELFGLTVVCDELLWLAGVGTAPNPIPIPFLVDPTAPYFDHLCVNVRCAGFGINFDLERPFPLPNPLLAFEVLALIADPLAPIKPDGPLARSLRIALRDAHVSIPPWARPLIPGGPELVHEEIDVELNVGTLILAAQWLARTAGPLVTQAQDAFAAGAVALQDLVTHPPRVDPAELLALLPPELRAVHCELSFAGFDASATLVLITPEDATRNDAAVNDLWQLPGLQSFTRNDLAALPAPRPGATAVLAVAEIDLFGALTARFFGRIADDGSFALVTAINTDPGPMLPLAINGLSLPLPLRLNGRMRLEGQVSAARRFAAIHAEGTGRWDIAPGVLRVTAGVAHPVELGLDSTGRFAISGDGLVELFGGALRMTGALSASESHLLVRGDLDLTLGGTRARPAVALHAGGTLHIGPGSTWGFDGSGELRLFDLALAETSVRLSDREIAVHAAVKRTRWRIGGLRFDAHVSGALDGRLTFAEAARPLTVTGRTPAIAAISALAPVSLAPAPAGSPHLRLRGRGTIEALGARLSGSLAVDADSDSFRVAAEGELVWLGKPWFAARLALASDGSAEFAGRTSVALDLTPSNLGIQVASLFLRADLAARFGFGPSGSKVSHEIDIDWSLGVRLPGGKPSQTFVLAMQKTHIAPAQPLNLELIHVQGMNFIPMSDVVIPIPVITTSGSEQFIRARINIPIIKDQLRFLMTDSLRIWLEERFGKDFVFGRKKLFKVPTDLKVDIEDHSLGELAASFGFRVRIRWNDNRLGFEIRKGTKTEFVGLDQLL